jgi:hypothetical protein
VNAIQLKHGPFALPASKGWPLSHMMEVDAQARVQLVRQSSDVEWLGAVVKGRDIQMVVRLAAERRLKRVNKKGQQ